MALNIHIQQNGFTTMNKWLVSICLTLGLLASTLFVVNAQSVISLTINNILVTPDPEKANYKVMAYISVVDSAGIPVKNLTLDKFSVIEDAVPMTLVSAETTNDPISLVLVLDTSGSMGGPAIEAAKEGANSLLLSLGSDDEVSVLSFDNTVRTVIDFTNDRQEAGQQLLSLNTSPNSGTCLYDATYQAVQKVAALPAGRRAVVLFTDGVDESLNGEPCSTYTIDDVIHLATQGNAIIPIYTLGEGGRIDQQALKRLADLTGGHFQFAPSTDHLQTIFQNLTDQLKYQYVITYTTASAQGNHTLVIQATTPGGSAKDTRNFISPAMPTEVLIKSPNDGQTITGQQVISAIVSGNVQNVKKVVFYVGGEAVGESINPPYELNFIFTSTFAGNTTISAVALGGNGEAIARQIINVNVIAPTSVSAVTLSPSESPAIVSSQPIVSSPSGFSVASLLHPPYSIILGSGLFLIVVAGVGLVVRKRSRGNVISETTFGKLEVLYSDSQGFIHKKFDITQPITRLGRLIADNDISFPDDKPVSKHHAIIEKKGEGLYLYEVAQGTTYGTFIGDVKIGTTPVILHDMDEIRLGTRLKLKFSLPISERTIDSLNPQADDVTIDFNLPPKERKDPFETQDPE